VVDALSRRVHEFHSTTINMFQSDLKGRISEAAKSYFHYMELVEKIQKCNLQKKIEDYKLGIYEILMYRNMIYVPNS